MMMTPLPYKLIFLMVCLTIISGCVQPAPVQLQEVQKPDGVDTSFAPATIQDRAGGCLLLAVEFVLENQNGWALVSCTQTHPVTGEPRSHAFAEKGDVVWEPIENRFFERDSYYRHFDVQNVSKYYGD